MIGGRQIQHCVTYHDQEFFVFFQKHPGQRLILRFDDHAVSYPLPELGLGGPELLLVTANHKRGPFPFFPFFFTITQDPSSSKEFMDGIQGFGQS
jgi:hypothetical protein